jgi:hypothetical protein
MACQTKVLGSSSTLLNVLVFMYIYLFLCKIWTNVGIDILENKKLSALIESLVFPFPKDWQLFKQKVSPKEVLQIVKPIILSGMVCLNIFGGGVVTYVYLVRPIDGYHFVTLGFFRRFLFSSKFFSDGPHCASQGHKCKVFKISFLTNWKETGAKWWHQFVFTCWQV